VIAFGYGDAVDRSELSRLAAPLLEQLRATDAIGWLGGHELGLLLRYTTSADAVAVAEKFCALLDAGGAPRLHCTVFAFPPAAFQSAIGPEASEPASAEPVT
jgi:GGDEF domain-containing protein